MMLCRDKPRNFGFDNIWEASLTLFECLSLEGYTELVEYLINDMPGGERVSTHHSTPLHSNLTRVQTDQANERIIRELENPSV